MKKLAIAIFALAVAASMAVAGSLSQFKAGDISFSVMDKDGATPMQAASIQMLGSEDGAVVAETSTDDLGQAVLAMDEGRYVIRVNDLNLALFEVGADGVSVCRVIMPDASLLVGGQDQEVIEEEEDDDDEGGAVWSASWFWPVVGGVIVAGVLVGAGFIIDNNTHHHHHHDGEPVPPPPPAKHKHPKKTTPPSAT